MFSALRKITRNLNISQKLTISYLLIGVFTISLVSVIFYQVFKKALLERTFAQLHSINMLKKKRIEDFYNGSVSYPDKNDLSTLKYNPPESELESIMFERTGMGSTGESYIVGNDYTLRSRSRFFPNQNPATILVNTITVKKAFAQEHSEGIIKDYRNVPVLSVARKLEIKNKNSVIVSEIDLDEAMTPVYKIRNYIILITFFISIIIVVITFFLAKKISSPILELKELIDKLSKGILPSRKSGITDNDEIGKISKAIDHLIEGLRRTTEFAYETGQGKFDASFEPLSEEDILGTTLISMRDSLKKLKEQEITLVRQKSAALIEGQEKERERIARELHDGIGQMLTAIRFKIEMAEVSVQIKDEIKSIIDETITEVRKISLSAMPAALLDFGLEPALNALCSKMGSYGKIEISVDYERTAQALPLNFEVSICLYRISQEALNNMVKYSKASRALVTVRKDIDKIEMTIADNGIGFDEYNLSQEGNGLRNMKERAKLLNGTLNIQSAPGKGTALYVEIPLMRVES